jgi:cytochrome c-type biogenesis protein CcmH
MIGFWILAAMMTLAVIMILVLPLFQAREAKDESDFALTVYRDQLAEIERDQQRGVLLAEQAKAAQLEIQRRILVLADAPVAQPGRTDHKRPIAVAAVLLPLFGVGLYLTVGAPRLPGQPFTGERLAAVPATPEFIGLRTSVMRHPSDAEAWLALARLALLQHRLEDSVDAFRHVVDLGKVSPEIYVDYGRALILLHDGDVSDDARDLLENALRLDSKEHMARFLLALRKAQQGNLDGALKDWLALEKDTRTDPPFHAILAKTIDKAARQLGKNPATLPGVETTD